MGISPNSLRKEIISTLNEVNQQLDNYAYDSPIRASLLLAKAECLNALVTLQVKRT
jgi:hypothetical protein